MNLDGLNEVLSNVLKNNQTHEILLHQHVEELRNTAKLKDLHHVKAATYETIQRIEQELETMRKNLKIAAPHVNNKSTIGCEIYRANDSIKDLYKNVETKASIRYVEKLNKTAHKAIIDLRDKVQFERAAKDQVERLSDTQKELVQMVKTLQTVLENKLDKVELAYLERVAAKIDDFGDFHREIKSRVQKNEQALEDLHVKFELQESRLRHVENELTKTKQDLATCANSRDLEALAARFLQIKGGSGGSISSEDLVILSEKVVNTQHQLASLAKKINVRLATETKRVAEHEKELDQKANLDLVEQKASLAYCEDRFAAMEKLLTAKADKEKVEQLTKWSNNADIQRHNLDNKLELALRFVDWFSARGEAFEHNFNLVEKSINRQAQHAFSNVNQADDQVLPNLGSF